MHLQPLSPVKKEAHFNATSKVQLPDDYLRYQTACHVQFEEFSHFQNGKSLGFIT